MTMLFFKTGQSLFKMRLRKKRVDPEDNLNYKAQGEMTIEFRGKIEHTVELI